MDRTKTSPCDFTEMTVLCMKPSRWRRLVLLNGMEVREPDDEIPFRSYKPVISPLEYVPTNHKPGLGELMDDLIQGGCTRLPSLAEHRQIHAWMQDNML